MNPSLETIISSLIDEGSRAHKSHNLTKGCALFSRKKSNVPGRRDTLLYFSIQSNNDVCDSPPKINTRFVH